MRGAAGPALCENCELIAVFSQRWLAEKHEVYPRNIPRIDLIDAWAEEDGISQPAGD